MVRKLLDWLFRPREPRQLQLQQSPTVFDSSSCSSSSVQQKHQVFLSFRGEDTRNNFTSHLHEALKLKGIVYFIDYQLEIGEEISPALLEAIEESMISTIVLSKKYASSSWCLEELCKILECKKRNGQKVIPIFYHVDPSDVRKQTGSFAEAFVEHVKKRPNKVEKWRAALKEVDNLSGWHLPGQPNDRPESQLIVEIVEEILKKLKYTSSCDTEGLIGIDSCIEKIESLLCFGSEDVRIIAIWGMGGIGKTTIAKVLYDRFFTKFEGRCFLPNVKENYGRGHLAEELSSKLLEDSNLNASTSSLPAFMKNRLQHKKVLIVLDDVDDPMQLDLLPKKHYCGPGSRIIVTSRDQQVLRQVVDEIYKVEGLNDNEALQLFSLHAFKQTHPDQDFMELSKKVVHYANGVPLALKIVGSTLCRRDKSYWEGHLNKIKKFPDPKIGNLLKISYDGLDNEEKNIFLDIACFFKGNDRYYVTDILNRWYISVESGITDLIDKSLITISYNELDMHDLLQQMGRDIVCRNPEGELIDPGKRSRLWIPEDIVQVLKKGKGTESVRGMLLDMSKIKEVLKLEPTAFARMVNLRFLKFHNSGFKNERKVFLPQQSLEYLSDALTHLHWDAYPSKSLPHKFCPDNLVELRMPNSHIERLWNGDLNLVKLKELDLSHSCHLTEIPDLSRATALVNINLTCCVRLGGVPSSIGCLSKLKYLAMTGCISIEELPSSIEHLVALEHLDLDFCEMLKNLPSGISKLKSLVTLSLSDCLSITKFPETSGNLRELYLSGTSIEQVHSSSIECLSQIATLHLANCAKLGCLSRNIFQSKFYFTVSGFSKLEIIQEGLGTVQELIANGTAEIKIHENDLEVSSLEAFSCLGLVGLLYDLDFLENLTRLSLKDCNLVEFPSRFTCMSSLTSLDLSGNSFELLPASIKQLLKLKNLYLSYCERLQLLPELPPHLIYLDLSHCKGLQLLPELPTYLMYLGLKCCERLQCLPKLPPHVILRASDCTSLEAVSGSFTICTMCEINKFPNPGLGYEFVNCINLDQNTIWAKTQLGIQQLATKDVKYYSKVHGIKDIHSSFHIFLPGSEIPEWFSFQNKGSSVTVQLPLLLHHHKVVGFAVCAVLGVNNDSKGLFDPLIPSISCRYNFKTNSGHGFSKYFSKYTLFQNDFIGPDHVYVSYDFNFYCHYYGEIGYHLNKASFHFSIPTLWEIPRLMVKKCGVCPLYAQDDLMEVPHEECSSLYDPMV